MKKIISLLLCLSIFLVTFNIYTTATSTQNTDYNSEQTNNSIILSENDFTISRINSCSVSGSTVYSAESLYPQFKINFADTYYIDSVSINITVAGRNYICSSTAGISVVGNQYIGAVTAGQSTDITIDIDETNKYAQAQAISCFGYWSGTTDNKPAVGEASITINYIEIIGTRLTETLILSQDEFTISNNAKCSITGNTINSWPGNRWNVGFTINLPQAYKVKSVKITASVANNALVWNSGSITLQTADGTTVASVTRDNSNYFNSTNTTADFTVAEENQSLEAAKIVFKDANWLSSPTDGNSAVTIERIEILCWENPIDDIEVLGDSLDVTQILNCGVEGNVITASTLWPKFLVTLPNAYYADSIDIEIKNDYNFGLAWHNGTRNQIDLIFDDGTTSVAKVTGTDWWAGVINANSEGIVNIVIPETCKSKRLIGIEMEGYFPGIGATVVEDGPITVTKITINNSLTGFSALVADKINNPVTYTNGINEYEQIISIYRNAIDRYVSLNDFSPNMLSASVDNNMKYGLEGTPTINVEVPHISSDVISNKYYIAELGIIAMPTEQLGDNELTFGTDGVISVYKQCVRNENLSDFASFSAPVVLGIDYANVQITARAYVIYSDGIDESVFYSSNTIEDTSVLNGTSIVTFPSVIEYTEKIGDANDDEEVNILDLIRLKKHLCDIEEQISFIGADTNADGEINALDLTSMRSYLLGVNNLPIEPFINEFLESDIWKTAIDGRTFSKNMSDQNFNANNYTDVNYTGGSDVRTEEYTRGMGLTAWHASEGYNISEATKAIDTANLAELNVTSKRTWGEGLNATSASSYTYATNLNLVLDSQAFSDGTTAILAPQVNSQNVASNIISNWSQKLINPLVRANNKLLLLGNEYRVYALNNTTGKYEYSGYDDVTLGAFRNRWCPARFGTIANLNLLCGTNYSSFDNVYPTSTNKLLFYEFWLYQRSSFRDVMRDVVTGMKDIYPDTSWGYATYSGPNGPLANNLYLDFLDYTSQNLYYSESYMRDLHGYSFQMDNLTAWSKTAPVMITEIGFRNGFTDESKAKAARMYKQSLNLLYMRPRMAGSYIFNYTASNLPNEEDLDSSWGMVDPYRNKYPSYYAVKQVYSDFKLLDSIYTGASNTPLVAITNLAADDKICGRSYSSLDIASILYSKGVPVQVVPSDDSTRFDTLEELKLIFNDNVMYQNPDGSGSVGNSLADYISNGGEIFRSNANVPYSLYGISSEFDAESIDEITAKFAGITVVDGDADNKEALWNELGEFIHGDFVSGNVSVKNNTVDENAVRVLDVEAFSTSLDDKTYDIETKMVYKNGEMYLCLVNTGDTAIDSVDITIGINNGVKCNLSPTLICSDEGTEVSKQRRAYAPSWIDASSESKVDYGTVTVKNLDTYAYVHLGRAVIS